MNSASFYTKVWVPKPGVGCKNGFMRMDELFLSFRQHFDRLDEITPYHNYPNTF